MDVVTQVAAASEEQSIVSEEIRKNIEAISSVTQESAAGTQQIARAAEELNQLTSNLHQLLNQFTLGTRTKIVATPHSRMKSLTNVSPKEGGHLNPYR